jgi:hypothetical protein
MGAGVEETYPVRSTGLRFPNWRAGGQQVRRQPRTKGRQGASVHSVRTLSASSPPAPQAAQQPATVASTVDRDSSAVEKQIVDVAEAMPEDKFNFSPEILNIPGSGYKGVRSFAVEVKHVAASNWFIWSPLTGEKLPQGLGDDRNGPTNAKTEAAIIKFPKVPHPMKAPAGHE